MPQVIITKGAAVGLERCRLFLFKENPRASDRAGQTIKKMFSILETNPEIGKPLEDEPILRELVIPFGSSGYIALYNFDKTTRDLCITPPPNMDKC